MNRQKMLNYSVRDVFQFFRLTDQQSIDPYIEDAGTSVCLTVLLCAPFSVNTHQLRFECSTDGQLEQNHV